MPLIRPCLATLLLMVVAAPLHAGETLLPSWSRVLERQVLSDDSLGNPDLPTWARCSDGSVSVVTLGGSLLGGAVVRRYVAGQEPVIEHVERFGFGSGLFDTALAIDPVGGGTYVQMGRWTGDCRLFHLDATGRRDWAMDTLAGGQDEGRCRGMEILADGSVVALRDYAVARVSANGIRAWQTASGAGGRYWQANAMRRDAGDVVWIVGQSGQSAVTMRYASNGTRLGFDEFLCGECIVNMALSIDVAADGSVAVGGGAGSEQPGFIAIYEPNGARRSAATTPVGTGYARVVHDGNGQLYGVTRNDDMLVQHLDRASGAVLWQRPGTAVVALADGVVVFDPRITATQATAVSAAGVTLWEKTLPASRSANVGWGRRDNGAVVVPLQSDQSIGDACGAPPRLVALDAAGGEMPGYLACVTPRDPSVRGMDSVAGIGVLVNLDQQLESYTENGDPRWIAYGCRWCQGYRDGDRGWWNAVLANDGGAWAFEYEIEYAPPETGLPPTLLELGLKRIDATGNITATLPMYTDATGELSRVFAAPGGAAVVMTTKTHLVWQHVDDTAVPVDTHTFEMSPFPTGIWITDARRDAEGNLTIVVAKRLSPMHEQYATVVRLDAHGGERWRYDVPTGAPVLSTIDDVGNTLIAYVPQLFAPQQLRHVGADGTVGPAIDLPFLPSDSVVDQLTTIEPGRFVLRSSRDLWLIDADARVSARRSYDTAPTVFAATAFGVLVAVPDGNAAVAEWLDPVRLRTHGQLAIDGDVTRPYVGGVDSWAILADGTAYGAPTRLQRVWQPQVNLARYALPDATPTDAIFRNGFD